MTKKNILGLSLAKQIFVIKYRASFSEAAGSRLKAKHTFINNYNNEPNTDLFLQLGHVSFKHAELWLKTYYTMLVSDINKIIIADGHVPNICVVDNGKSLNNNTTRKLFSKLGITLINTSPYRAQSKSVERFFHNFGRAK